MYVRFWGTRGSIAAPGPRTAQYGGNTSCVEVRADDGTIIVLDCGTGARELGLHLLTSAPRPLRLHLFIGHTHWDHIQGFPFFLPAFLPDTEMNIYAAAGFQRSLEEAMAGQMQYSYFPVKLQDLRSRIHFTELTEGFFRVGDVLVETQHLNHTAPTIAYRITSGGASVAYVTDHEPFWKPGGPAFHHPGDQRHIAFLKGTNLVIHDAQYTAEEYSTKVGWGHSTIEYATDVALAAGVGQLALFHHDPTHDDAMVTRMEVQARDRVAAHGGNLEVFAAAEGMELDIKGSSQMPDAPVASALRRQPIAGGRVLVVSSDEADITAIGQILAEDDLVLLSTPGRRTALAQVREVAPDLVIINDALPDGDGTGLIRQLRTRLGRRTLPILLLTENPEAEAAIRGMDAGATDCLAKPFSPPMLRSRVRAWLARAQASASARGGGAGRRWAAAGVAPPSGDAAEPNDEVLPFRPGYAEELAEVPLFRPLSQEQREALAVRAVEQVYQPGRIVISQGEPSDRLFIILAGRVRVIETTPESPQLEMFLGELTQGEVFGEMGILSEQGRSASVMAVERTRCLVLTREGFVAALRDSPELAMGLLRVLVGRIADANRLLARYAPDPLTGLSSRRAFLDQYRRFAASASRRNSGVLLLFLDVVGLKRINDRYGYVVGDEVLRAVGDSLVEATRNTDLVARYGGDEFVVLVEDGGLPDANLITERLREKLADITARRGLPLSVECSIGLASSSIPPESAEELLRVADQDMQRSKAQQPRQAAEPPAVEKSRARRVRT